MREHDKNQILIISQHFPPENIANASRIYEISKFLSEFGLDTIVFAPHPIFPKKTFKKTRNIRRSREIEGVKVLNLWGWQQGAKNPGFLSRMLYYLIFPLHASLWAIIYSKNYDLIITSNPPVFTAIPGIISKKILKKKWIIDSRDSWIDASISLGFLKKASTLEKIARKFEKICYNNADLVGATTKVLARRISNNYNIKDSKIILIPNGADTETFYHHKVSKKNQIIFLGNIGHAQDLEKYIQAMKIVTKKIDVKLLIVGDGEKKEELENIVQKQALEDIIEFKGLIPRAKIPELLSESLIGIAPMKKLKSLEYMVPVKVYEYMACELPFLASGMGEIVELARKSKAGIITKDSSNAIAKSIINLLNNPQKLETMGKQGREYVKSHYDRTNIVYKLKTNLDQCKTGISK
ncbi:MAG: glycosyltransferase family 4 protein [Methanobacterium sp.]